MNDYNEYYDIIELLKLNDIPYRTDTIYDEDNDEYPCIWLQKGHIEFDRHGYLDKVVTY